MSFPVSPTNSNSQVPINPKPGGSSPRMQVQAGENTSILARLRNIKGFFEGIFHKNRHVTSNTIETAAEVSNDSIPENKSRSSLETLFGAHPKDLTDGEVFKRVSIFYTSIIKENEEKEKAKLYNEYNASVIKLAKGIKEIWNREKMTPEANEAMEKLGEVLVALLDKNSNVSAKKQAYLRAIDYAKMVELDTGLLKSFSPWGESTELKPEIETKSQVKTLKTFTSLEEILKEIEEKQKTIKKDLELARTRKEITFPIKKLSTTSVFLEGMCSYLEFAKKDKNRQKAVELLEQYKEDNIEKFEMLDDHDKEIYDETVSFLKSGLEAKR